MFVKVKSYMLQNEIGFALKAQKYDRWMYVSPGAGLMDGLMPVDPFCQVDWPGEGGDAALLYTSDLTSAVTDAFWVWATGAWQARPGNDSTTEAHPHHPSSDGSTSRLRPLPLAVWLQDRTPDNTTWISSNEYIEHQPRYKIGKVLVAKARGSSCFDFPYYSENNADLQILHTNQSLWKHFVYYGQFESRPHRCGRGCRGQGQGHASGRTVVAV